MMGALLLTIAALLESADDPDPTALIRRLGSERFAERVEATKALEKLGSAALPALRAAKGSDDPRVRVRVEALLKTLDRGADLDRLTRPTLIKLDFRDRPLAEVVDELNARHKLGLTLQFGPLPDRGMMMFGGPSPAQKAKEDAVRSRLITLEAPETLPFWQAVDRLCEAGQLQPDLHPQGRFGLTSGRFLLFSGMGGTKLTSDSGAIRVEVVGLHSTFESDFVGTPGRSRGDRDLNVRMVAVAEPALAVRMTGPPKLVEAVDDRGRTLLPPETPKPQPNDPGPAYRQPPTLNGPTGFDFSASLRLPDQEGRSIRRLRGSVPVVVVGYASDPIVLSLGEGAGKSARNDDVTVTILDVVRDDNTGVTVEVEVDPNRPGGQERVPWNRPGPPDFVTFRTDQLTTRLELLDADGRELALSWNQGHGRDHMTMQRRVRLTPTILYEDQPPDAAGRFQPRKAKKPLPVELRYHGFIQNLTEIQFEFRDIPLP
jgi:hypothetical protein